MCSVEPSLTERSLPEASVTVGATLATVTVKALVSLPPFLSVTFTDTVRVAGPSSYVWLFEPRLPVLPALNVVWVGPSPQSTSTDHGASGPGSVKEPSAKDFAAPS